MCRVVPEPHGAGLVRTPGDWYVALHVDAARDQVVRMHAQMTQVLLHPAVELFHRLGVVRRVAQHDIAVPIERHPVVGSGRSSADSQKSTACSATSRKANVGANRVSIGFSPRYIGADDLPTICKLPMGWSKSASPK